MRALFGLDKGDKELSNEKVDSRDWARALCVRGVWLGWGEKCELCARL